MSGPWERYQSAGQGPWTRYQATDGAGEAAAATVAPPVAVPPAAPPAGPVRFYSVVHPAINNGRPTNVPNSLNGQPLTEEHAIRAAAVSRRSWPTFDSIEAARAAAHAPDAPDQPGIGSRFLRGAGNLAAGVASGFADVGDTLLNVAARPVGAVVPAVKQWNDDRNASLEDFNSAHADSGAFTVGRIGGNVAATWPVGGIAGKAIAAAGAPRLGAAVGSAGFKTGVPAAPGVGGWLTDAGIRTAGGAISGGLTAAGVDPSNTAAGVGIGAALPNGVRLAHAAGGVVGATGRGVQALAAPFTERGRQAIASRAMVQAAGDDAPGVAARLAQAAELVPGSIPTAGQIAQNGGIAALERSVAAAHPAAFTERALDQSAARLQALRNIAGDDTRLSHALVRRESLTRPIYQAAGAAVVPVDDFLAGLLRRPSVQQALARAQRIAQEEGREFGLAMSQPGRAGAQLVDEAGNVLLDLGTAAKPATITGQTLQDIKMGLDALLKDPTSGIAGKEAALLAQTRVQLMNWGEKAIPDLKRARELYAELSKPIGQMKVGREMLERIESALADYGALGRETAGRYAGALRAGDETARRATNFRGESMRDLMTPEQMAVMENIGRDLARKANAENLGRGTGSDTYQKLAAQNFAHSSGLPQRVAEWLPPAAASGVGATIGGAVGGVPGGVVGANLGLMVRALQEGAETRVQQAIAQSLLQPKTAATMMQDELSRRAVAAAPRQPVLSDQTRDALAVLFGRSSPVLVTGQ